jgi:ribonuclease P protein component
VSKFTVIKKNSDFQMIFEKGHSISGRYTVVYFLPNCLDSQRYGFCVGKKVGTAVTRNRLKRIFREVIMNCSPAANLGLDFVIIAKKSILTADFKSINDEISHILGMVVLKSSQARKRTEDSR